MVSFVCNACGQTVRKNQVEKHYSTVCRQCEVLSCIDCGKDFHGDDYASHTSCITEAEKYQGKLFQAKDKANKGEQKQQEWIKQLQDVSTSDTIDPSIKKHLKALKHYSNIPRKKAKFQNFCKNSVNIYDQPTLDKLWDAFSGAKGNETTNGSIKESNTEPTAENNNNDEQQQQQQQQQEMSEDKSDKPDKKSKSKKEKRKRKKQDEELEETKSKKRKGDIDLEEDKQHKKKSKKKRKQEQNENDNNEDMNGKAANGEENGISEEHTEELIEEVKGKFNWGSVIKQVLKKAPDNELPVKKLRKKVIAEFLSRGGDSKTHTDNEVKALFLQKLNKNPKIKVKKEVAKLCR